MVTPLIVVVLDTGCCEGEAGGRGDGGINGSCILPDLLTYLSSLGFLCLSLLLWLLLLLGSFGSKGILGIVKEARLLLLLAMEASEEKEGISDTPLPALIELVLCGRIALCSAIKKEIKDPQRAAGLELEEEDLEEEEGSFSLSLSFSFSFSLSLSLSFSLSLLGEGWRRREPNRLPNASGFHLFFSACWITRSKKPRI